MRHILTLSISVLSEWKTLVAPVNRNPTTGSPPHPEHPAALRFGAPPSERPIGNLQRQSACHENLTSCPPSIRKK